MPIITAKMLDPQGYLMPYQKKRTRTEEMADTAQSAAAFGKLFYNMSKGGNLEPGSPPSLNTGGFRASSSSSPYSEALSQGSGIEELPPGTDIKRGEGSYSRGVERVGGNLNSARGNDPITRLLLALMKGGKGAGGL